jgi:hypothetical protein
VQPHKVDFYSHHGIKEPVPLPVVGGAIQRPAKRSLRNKVDHGPYFKAVQAQFESKPGIPSHTARPTAPLSVMVDAIGLAASILTPVDFAKEINNYLHVYRGRSERDELLCEVESTMQVLSQLHEHANSDEWAGPIKALATPNGPLHYLEKRFRHLMIGLKHSEGDSRARAIGKALLWLFEKKEVVLDLLTSLEHSNPLLVIALHNDAV